MAASYRVYQLSEAARRNGNFRNARLLVRPLQFFVDLLVLIAAFTLAYLVRFDFAIPVAERGHFLTQLVPVVLLQFVLLRVCGVYTFIWRYVGMAELRTFVKASLYSAIPLLLMRLLLTPEFQNLRIPVSIILMDTVLAFGGVLGVRVLRRDSTAASGPRRFLSARRCPATAHSRSI